MQVTLAGAHNPLVLGYESQASVYSWLDEHPQTTFGFDEADKIFGTTGRKTSREILAAVINDGYTPKGQVMVMRSGKAALMPVWCPIALAGIGRLPDDTATRAITIHLEKKTPDQVYLPALHEDELSFIGAGVSEWLGTADAAQYLKAQPRMADGVGNDPRERLIWAPLSAIASYAGMHDQFTAAAQEIQTGILQRPPTPLYDLLLADLREAWPADGPAMASATQAINWVRAANPGRWHRLLPGRVGEITLAGMLRQAGIVSRTSNGKRGYRHDDVMPV
jgi:hypothetical protein